MESVVGLGGDDYLLGLKRARQLDHARMFLKGWVLGWWFVDGEAHRVMPIDDKKCQRVAIIPSPRRASQCRGCLGNG